MTLKTPWLGSFAWKAIVCTIKVRDETLEMGKDMQIKHSISSPSKVWGDLFLKKALHGWGDKLFWVNLWEGLFYMRINNQIMEWEKKSFTNAFPINLNTVNLKIFPGHSRRHTFKQILTSLLSYGRIYPWGLWLRGFKGRVKFSFPLFDPDLKYLYILWKGNTTIKGLNLKNTFCTLCLWVWRFHLKPVFFFRYF